MNWKLILQLSMLGLALELASVFFIPSLIEPLFWLALYVFYAYAIAKNCRASRFLNGLALGLLNSLWITGAHDLFVTRFLASHPGELALIDRVHTLYAGTPRQIMSVTGPAAGLFWGLVVGVFAVIGGMMMKPTRNPELA